MEKINLPEIKLREPERIWLTKLYEKIKKNQPISYKSIRSELFKELPVNFHPNNIDKRLVRANGEDITLLGIYAIDPKEDILKQANKLLYAIRDHLIANPEEKQLNASGIAELAKMPEADVGLIFKLISPYGHFWRSAGSRNESKYYGYSYIDISDDTNVFDQYLYFTSIEDLINRYYKEEEEQQRESLIFQSSKQQSEKEELNPELIINPIFTSRISQIDLKLCFVLMPFTEDWSERVYRKYIRENIDSMGLQCLRADNLTGQIIIEDIWTKINQAAFIIADVTNRNPNVMYELGIAHTIGKPVILITQNVKNIPFDFKHLRHHEYKDNADGQILFSNLLKTRIIPAVYQEFYPKASIFP